jgi:SAM-dependent methyltransferase
MHQLSARYYDKLYAGKDYAGEVESLLHVIRRAMPSGARTLLDVACGTGRHLELLQPHFSVEGLDNSDEQLEEARRRLPGVPFHCLDMMDFALGRDFDVVTCLFSSIGYVRTLDKLERAVGSMAAHLNPGGLLIIEPWFTPDSWHAGTVHAVYVNEPELKIARINTSLTVGRLSVFDFHYLVGTPSVTEHFAERHKLGLFTVEEMQGAIEWAGLRASYDATGLTGRGVHLGQRV